MPRRYSARASSPRKRIAKIRHDVLAYSVPRQGVPLKRRGRRTQAEIDAEFAGARAGLAYYNARHGKAQPKRHKKRSLWAWLWGR